MYAKGDERHRRTFLYQIVLQLGGCFSCIANRRRVLQSSLKCLYVTAPVLQEAFFRSGPLVLDCELPCCQFTCKTG